MKTLQLVVLLLLFWVTLSTSIHPLDAAVGLALAAVIGAWTVGHLWKGEETPYLTAGQSFRLLFYLPYLIKEIVVACVHVAIKVLDPRMPIDPVIITHETSLERPLSRVVLANSITLTPGTLTVDLEGSTLLVHCLGPEFLDKLRSGELEERIARVFEGA